MEEEGLKIYNTYLRALANASDRPYRRVKEYSRIAEEKQAQLVVLVNFFRRYPHINIDMYFDAPYKLWGDSKFYKLAFFNKRKSLTCYVAYKKTLILSDPDEEYHVNMAKKSMDFINNFCLKNDISINTYIEHKTGNYTFLDHLKSDKVSIYALFAFENFKDLFRSIDIEQKKFLFGDLYSNYEMMYRKFQHSEKCRNVAEKRLQSFQ